MSRTTAQTRKMKSRLSEEIVLVHGVLTDTQPVDFDALGVAGAIDRLAFALREHGTEVILEAPHHWMVVDRRSAMLLYRAAQELLSNTYKFAGASTVTVRLASLSHAIQLKVTDDGSGFDERTASSARHGGMGLRLLRIAVGAAGGETAVNSGPGAGTCVTVKLPLD